MLRKQYPLNLLSDFKPQGDQPRAIEELVNGLEVEKLKHQTLLGVTGSGKTFTIANVIQKTQMPTLILAPNKTLAAQLYSEFKALFPDNAVEYFVSYYDFYQPEAYIPSTDTFIEKDSAINEEIDKLRHSATRSLFERKDVIIVSSVSCIYGLGSPEDYLEMRLELRQKMKVRRDDILRSLLTMGYTRNDLDFHRGTFRVRGDILDIFPSYESEEALRVEFFGSEISSLHIIDPLRGVRLDKIEECILWPASHYVIEADKKKRAMVSIREELRLRLQELKSLGKMLEYERLERRTLFDLEMMQEVGYCPGIENYSRHLTGRGPGEPPPTLLDYFPKEWLLVIDESHISVPQVGAMYRGDRARKMNLVEHGFRLPSALDNRPLNFEEFENTQDKVIYVSATPADFELARSNGRIVEQIIRPTGLVDPLVEVRPATQQVQNVLEESRKSIAKGHRILITTLTKKMSEDLTEYFRNQGVKVRYLHSDVDTLERVEILQDLRKGVFDVLVGINLLREGLDLPEVALVAIMDADKEGFLRSKTSLIQTFGRAARNLEGRVICYADRMTKSLEAAIEESLRRRQIQLEYNLKNGITPKSTTRSGQKSVNDRVQENLSKIVNGESDFMEIESLPQDESGKALSLEEIGKRIKKLEKDMREAAKDLEFERAAELRDKLLKYREMELTWKN